MKKKGTMLTLAMEAKKEKEAPSKEKKEHALVGKDGKVNYSAYAKCKGK